MTHTPLFDRIRAEYMEMPGLRVTLGQAQRLFGLEWTLCKTVFDTLVDEQFLRLNERGMYVRASEGSTLRVPSLETGLGADARTAALS